ncbi:MAG TPA: hypothetical protein VFT89_07475 [Rhizobiaceae bacterium]|nr:hypothetical protein [Rhizobiaceae bacterium]
MNRHVVCVDSRGTTRLQRGKVYRIRAVFRIEGKPTGIFLHGVEGAFLASRFRLLKDDRLDIFRQHLTPRKVEG